MANLGNVVPTIFAVLAMTIKYYSFALLIRILLSWFPNLDWSNPILSTISSITDPYLNIFRGIIPPLGGIDFSAILAIITLQLTESLLFRSYYLFAMSTGY